MIYDTIKFIWTSPVIMCSLFTVLFFFMITEYMASDTKSKKNGNKSSSKKKSDKAAKNCKGAIVKRTEYIYFKLLLASFASAGLIQMWWCDNAPGASAK